jgi:RND family efflux transporter MFP subunit
MAIVDINPIRALLEVTEKDYGRLRAGQLVGLKTDAFPERRFEGTVTRIAPVLKNTTRTAQVEVRVANPEGALKPGMFVRAELLLETRAKAQVVPLAAIVRKENEPPAVFLLNPDRESVRRVPVKLGISTQEVAEIVSPPLTGQVISLGSHLLDPKSKVSTGGKQRGEGKGEGKGGKPARGPKAPSDAPAAAKP